MDNIENKLGFNISTKSFNTLDNCINNYLYWYVWNTLIRNSDKNTILINLIKENKWII